MLTQLRKINGRDRIINTENANVEMIRLLITELIIDGYLIEIFQIEGNNLVKDLDKNLAPT